MKISIAIMTASDGGAFITMDPSAPQLMEDVLAGRGTSAHTYALAAYQAMHEQATRAAAAGAQMETGELPEVKH